MHHPAVGRVLARSCLCVFFASQCGLFILCCGEGGHLVCRSFLEGNDSYVDLVCPWKEVSARSSYATILQKSKDIF